MKILVTGAAGFIAGYLIEELLGHDYDVVGLDNYSKYGPLEKSYSKHPRFRLVQGDVKDTALMKEFVADCDHLVAGAAMIGGISYFHEFAYDLLAENERIIASTFDAAIWAHEAKKRLKKITVLSSSMVFESATQFPTPEGEQLKCPPPLSTYGFQKLACEYFAKGAFEQYKLPYTIVRPFNCVGIGERRAKSDREIMSGNVKLAMSHVVPDLVQKIVKGQDPLHILGAGGQVRHYTYGGDLAKGIRVCIEHPAAVNEDFNISTPESTTVLQLAEAIWKKLKPGKPFRHVSDEPFTYDVQKRVPDVSKAKRVLGFSCSTSLDLMLDEVIPWVKQQVDLGEHLMSHAIAQSIPPVDAKQENGLWIVVPVYNEADNFRPFYASLKEHVRTPYTLVVVYDFDEDTTLQVVKDLQRKDPSIVLLKNDTRGVLGALKTGLRYPTGGAVLVTMADCSDDHSQVDEMFALYEKGFHVVAASRYAPGGGQKGGPLLKKTLSRVAGASLRLLAGIPTWDPTNNFKLYSKELLDQVEIESMGGFEVALELTVKAHGLGLPIAEIPTVWTDRVAGKSNFKLAKWLPRYLRWYGTGMMQRLRRS